MNSFIRYLSILIINKSQNTSKKDLKIKADQF